jgi:hypothetical protein
MILGSSFEGTQVTSGSGAAAAGANGAEGPSYDRTHHRGPCADDDDQQGPDGLYEPPPFLLSANITGTTINFPTPEYKRIPHRSPRPPLPRADHAQPAARRHFRFAPPLTLSREEADRTVELYGRGLAKLMDCLRAERLSSGR